MPSIAIIGAGIAGLACAARLQVAGATLQIFDKGRAPGGRMATRELQLPSGTIGLDHGAQYFTAHTPAFQAQCERWKTAGVIAPWQVAVQELAPPRRGQAPATERLRGVSDLRHLTAYCAQGLPLHRQAEVVRVARLAAGWALQLADGREYSGFDYLLLALPAEQTAALLAEVAPGLSVQAAAARTAPCWAGLFAFTHDHAAKHQAIRGSGEGTLGWLARSAQGPAWVVHATPAWSRAHLEQSATWVSAALEHALRARLPGLGPSVQAVAHRWRYALVEQSIGVPFGWDENLRLGACGDGWLGARVELAWSSGDALGARLAADFSRRS